MLTTITLHVAHNTCVSSVSNGTSNCFSIFQGSNLDQLNSLVRSVLKGISVNGHVQHLDCLVPELWLSGRCTVR